MAHMRRRSVRLLHQQLRRRCVSTAVVVWLLVTQVRFLQRAGPQCVLMRRVVGRLHVDLYPDKRVSSGSKPAWN